MSWCATNRYNNRFNYLPYNYGIQGNQVNPYNNAAAFNPYFGGGGGIGNVGFQLGNIGPQGIGNSSFNGIQNINPQESGIKRFFRNLAGFALLSFSNNILTSNSVFGQ